ncbi:MAG: beta-ketoacyl synthase chain length factor [Endomicrobium sp.]|nr:beta-ketoacyl synthase chain length factor [Endomicrobium sp.]
MSIKNAVYAADAQKLNDFFQPKQLRRLDNLQKLVLCAAAQALVGANAAGGKDILTAEKKDTGLIIATGKGATAQTCAFMDGIIDYGDELASPLAFSSSVHNALETAVTALLNLQGVCLSVSDGASSFNTALTTAYCLLKSKKCKEILLCAADEINPAVLKEYGDKVFERPAAAAFLLSYKSGRGNGRIDRFFAVNSSALDEFNPSRQAFNAAREFAPFILKDEASRIVCDYIKTYLAGDKSDILSVFENHSAKELLERAPKDKLPKIYEGLKLLCAAQEDFADGQGNEVDNKKSVDSSVPATALTIEEQCFNALNKNARINFFTSGSTGVPKNCIHSKDMINEEVEGLLFLFRDIERIISTVPSHHSYGFIFGLQTPRFLDVPVKRHIPLPFLEWGTLLQENDLLAAFPLFLKYLMELDFKFPKGVTILTSTAPCPDELIEKIYKNGAKRLIEIYGASEAGAIAYREKAFAPFTLLPYWDIDAKGEIVIRKRTDLKIEMPDIITFESERVFRVSGRKDSAVQVAGVNVYPSKVADILKQNPLVKDAAVRLGGERLKAFIVLKNAAAIELAKKELHKYMERVLTAHEMPKNITFGDKIPTTPFGKKTDWQ